MKRLIKKAAASPALVQGLMGNAVGRWLVQRLLASQQRAYAARKARKAELRVEPAAAVETVVEPAPAAIAITPEMLAVEAITRAPATLTDIPNNNDRYHEDTPMSAIAALFQSMQSRFNAQAAAGLDAVFQFELTDGDTTHIVIENQTCQVVDGEHDDPTVTLIMDSDTLQQVMTGELDGMQAFMTGRIRADGNIMLATKLNNLFPLD
ncbi:SCP2 sterol-binding domain-containing protein [Pokkaliibacter sp. MBI-7]